jgi:hypothetical protein
MSADSDFATAGEALAEFGFHPPALMRWREFCLPLGRAINTKTRPGRRGFRYSRKDLQQIRQAMDNSPGHEFTDEAGEAWADGHVIEARPFCFPFTRAMRMAGVRRDGTVDEDTRAFLLLDVDNPRRPRARQVVIHRKQGFQLKWYFNKQDYTIIRNNLDKGRVESKVHGPGKTRQELKAELGVSQSFLKRHKITTWFEVRIGRWSRLPRAKVTAVFRPR